MFYFRCFSTVVEQTFELSVMWDAMTFMWRHFIVIFHIPSGQALRPWWRHQMEIFSPLLAFCVGSFDVFFHLCLNKRLSKQSWGWWFETPLRSLWRHLNVSYFLCQELNELEVGLDLTPRMVSQYLLITGDFAGFTAAMKDLLEAKLVRNIILPWQRKQTSYCLLSVGLLRLCIYLSKGL